MDRDQLRKDFEEIVWREYFLRSIKFHKEKQFADCNAIEKELLFKRRLSHPDSYADDNISAMWFAWELAANKYTAN